MSPSQLPATILVPPAEQAIQLHPFVGAVVRIQVAPELVETPMGPYKAARARVLPSAEEAAEYQNSWMKFVSDQVAPESVER
jgi:hypothetical protein